MESASVKVVSTTFLALEASLVVAVNAIAPRLSRSQDCLRDAQSVHPIREATITTTWCVPARLKVSRITTRNAFALQDTATIKIRPQVRKSASNALAIRISPGRTWTKNVFRAAQTPMLLQTIQHVDVRTVNPLF